jgi:hypothetical protein
MLVTIEWHANVGSAAAQRFYRSLGASPLSPSEKYWYIWEDIGVPLLGQGSEGVGTRPASPVICWLQSGSLFDNKVIIYESGMVRKARPCA